MLKYATKLFFLALLMALAIPPAVFAQVRVITGKVTSSDDGTALSGASVTLKGTANSAATDANGDYRLSNVPESGGILVFSFIGYQTHEVPISEQNTVNISLSPDATQLSEVVVTSLGIERSRKSLGFAVQTVGAKELTEARQPNIVSALQGQVAGVQITNTGGGPGMGARIVVRGLTSLNPNADNQPLFIIDGIPIDNSVNDNSSNQRGMSNRAADINPNDIETISILKGAAATGLYGVRAANGAVVITTKSGASGSGLTINAGTNFSAEEINKLPEFQRNYGRGWFGIDDGSVYSASGALIEAQSVVDPSYIFYDNYKNFYRTGGMRDHFFNMSGGKDAFTFYTSINNTNQEGIIPFSDWGRTSARLRGTAKFSEKFDVEASVNYSNSGGNRVPHTTMGERLMYWSHTQDITQYENPDGTQIAGILSANPLYNAKYMTYVDNVDRTISNLSFNYKPIDWLQFTYRFGHDFYVDKREEIAPGPLGIAGENRSGLSALGFMEQRRFINRVVNSNFFATFDKQITPDLRATVRAGHELFETDLNYSYNFGEEFVTPGFYSFSNVTRHVITENTYRRRLIGAYGDASLDYKGFLYLNLTARNDWTSTLPKGNNSFFYPSASMSFVFNDVLNLPEMVDFGKLRAAYGQVGKDTDPYRTAATYASATGFPLNGQVGYVRSASRGSDQLVPEMTTTLEFGTELQFFKNRLGVDFTWYKANSKDQILAVPVSTTTGYSQVWINAGEIENKGIELILNGTPVKTGNFRWDATVNFTRNRNMVVDIAEGVTDIALLTQNGYVNSAVTMRIAKDRPYGDLYGTSYERYYEGGKPEGVINLDKDRPKVIATSGGFAGFPLMNTTDQVVLGNGMPNWLAGVRNTFSYKGVSLSVLIDTRWKVDQFDQYGVWLAAFLKPDYTNDRNDMVIFDGVTPDGQTNTQQVWLGQGLGPDGRNYDAGYYRNIHRVMSENFVYDASYIKLRNATLAYNLPTQWLTPLHLKGVSVSASVNNIILWTPWRNFDPESYSTGAGSNATALTGMGYPGAEKHVLFFKSYPLMLKNMKLRIFILLIITGVFTSCENYLDVNTDPNNPTAVPVKGLMSVGSVRTASNTASMGYHTSYFVQYLAGPNAGGNTDTHQEINPNGTWVAIYNVLSNLSDMELMAEEQGAPNYVGAAKIMKAINLALLVDAWNNAPYSDAFFVQTLKPTYDDGQQLYTEIFTLLTDGIANLQQPTTTLIMGADDFMFGGNLSQWIKTAYALRARYLNHLSKTSSYDPNAVLAAIANGLESNADDASVTFSNEVRNPWGAVAINQAGLVLDGWISQQIVEAMDGTTFDVVDPRMEFMFSRTQHGTFRGTRNGAGRDPDVVDLRLDASTLVEASFYANRASPVLVMTFAEQKFIEAEAQLALNNQPAAYAAYLAGIRAHMDMLGVTAENRDAYINNPAVSVGDADITLALIMKEKYVALYLSPETWNDARRFNFAYADMTIPAQLNPELNGQFSRRLQYPSSEFSTNSDNVPRVNLLDRIWWDQN